MAFEQLSNMHPHVFVFIGGTREKPRGWTTLMRVSCRWRSRALAMTSNNKATKFSRLDSHRGIRGNTFDCRATQQSRGSLDALVRSPRGTRKPETSKTRNWVSWLLINSLQEKPSGRVCRKLLVGWRINYWRTGRLMREICMINICAWH